MLSKKTAKNGFTLIELLMVVAIIGIIAAIITPYYSRYRLNGFNSAAVSDLRNSKNLQEVLFLSYQTYGSSEANVILGLVGGSGGAGELINGSLPASTETSSGAALAGTSTSSTKVGVGLTLSNGVFFYATNVPGNASNAYVMLAKHIHGNRVFITESASSTLKFVQNDLVGIFIGVPLAVGGSPAAGVPAAASVSVFVTSSVAGNGYPNPNWSEL